VKNQPANTLSFPSLDHQSARTDR